LSHAWQVQPLLFVNILNHKRMLENCASIKEKWANSILICALV